MRRHCHSYSVGGIEWELFFIKYLTFELIKCLPLWHCRFILDLVVQLPQSLCWHLLLPLRPSDKKGSLPGQWSLQSLHLELLSSSTIVSFKLNWGSYSILYSRPWVLPIVYCRHSNLTSHKVNLLNIYFTWCTGLLLPCWTFICPR